MRAPTIETATAKIRMVDGVVRVEIKEDAQVEVRDAMEHVEAAHKLCGHEKFPLLADITRVRSTSREARNVYGSEEASEVLTALALLVDSPISKVIGNFYVGVTRPRFPTKIFTDEAKAMAWLKSI
jgi:hypothetical protein